MPGPAEMRQGGLCDSRVSALAQGVTEEDEGIDQRHAHRDGVGCPQGSGHRGLVGSVLRDAAD